MERFVRFGAAYTVPTQSSCLHSPGTISIATFVRPNFHCRKEKKENELPESTAPINDLRSCANCCWLFSVVTSMMKEKHYMTEQASFELSVCFSLSVSAYFLATTPGERSLNERTPSKWQRLRSFRCVEIAAVIRKHVRPALCRQSSEPCWDQRCGVTGQQCQRIGRACYKEAIPWST